MTTTYATKYSPVFRWVEKSAMVSAAIAAVIAAVHLIHHAPAVAIFGGVVIGWLLADFISGVVHWFSDTWFTDELPILGPTLIRNFREHHVYPLAMTRHDWIETNGANALVSLLILAPLALANHYPGRNPWMASSLLFLAIYSLFTNQVHKWAHQGARAPRFVRVLQSAGIILSAEAHRQHHLGEHTVNYSILSGQTNALLDRLGFFRGLERMIEAGTAGKLIAREDDRKHITGAAVRLSSSKSDFPTVRG